MAKIRNMVLGVAVCAMASFASVDSTLLNLVMPDAKIISGIQVQQSKSSPFGQYVLAQMQLQDAQFTKLMTETGFDPRRDLTELVAGTGGTVDAPTVLVVGRGVFNPAKILAAAKEAGGTIASYNGVDLITGDAAPLPNHPTMAVGFLDASTALLGNLDVVKAAIDRRQAGPFLDAPTQAKVRDLAAVNDAWFLSTAPITDFFAGKVSDSNLQGAMKGNLLQAVLQASGGIKFGSTDIRISGEAVTRSDKDASALADVVRFLVGLIQMNKEADPNAKTAASILDTLQVTTQASTMKLSLSIPESEVEKLFMPKGGAAKKARVKRAAAH